MGLTHQYVCLLFLYFGPLLSYLILKRDVISHKLGVYIISGNRQGQAT